jgi:hypothetical protein
MFGLDEIGKQAVTEARATVAETMEKIDPLVHGIMNRLGGIVHGLLDRLNGTEITIKVSIPPVPKATAVDDPVR